MSVWVLDASVLIKAVLEEPDSEFTDSIWATEQRCLAPVTAIPECVNAVVKKLRAKILSEALAFGAARDLVTLPVDYAPLHGFEGSALFEAARAGGLTAHDAVYLLLAEQRDGFLVSADKRLLRGSKSSKRWRDRVIPLADWRP